AVVAAADALVADQAELERGAAMGAVQFQKADAAALVAVGDEVLAKDADASRQVAQFAGEDHRLPEAPLIFPARRPRPDARQLLVIRRPFAVIIGAIGRIQKRRSHSHDRLLRAGLLIR